MDLTSFFFSATATCARAPVPSYRGQIQNSAEFGLGPLINGLTYPVFQYFQFACHGTVVTVAIPAVAVAEARAGFTVCKLQI